jgi:hypothetical protein
MDLLTFLKMPQQDISNLILKYLVDKKVSRQYKNLIAATLKHVCEINDIVLNWKKIKKFVNSEIRPAMKQMEGIEDIRMNKYREYQISVTRELKLHF